MANDRTAFIEGLRELSDWLEAHPEAELPYIGSYVGGNLVPSFPIFLIGGNQRERIATIAQAMGHAEKEIEDFTKYGGEVKFRIWRRFGGIVLYAQGDRGQVCERVTTADDKTEWRVPPVLAGGAS